MGNAVNGTLGARSGGGRQGRVLRTRVLIGAAAILLTTLVAALVPAPAAAAQRDRPNVVVVMTDDQDTASVRVMRTVKRQLARRGTTFENSFATFPLCCPSRATFLTGQYAHNHGVLSNENGFGAFDPRNSLAVSMRRAGYRTGYVGKYLSAYQGTGAADVPPGWNQWFVPVGPGGDVKMFDHRLLENDRVRRYGSRPRDYQTDVFARKAQRFISQSARRPKPFFLTVATTAPHREAGDWPRNPRPAPRHRRSFRNAHAPRSPSYNEPDVSDKPSFVRPTPLSADERRNIDQLYGDRLASLLAVDDAVRGIIRELRDTRELRRTLIVFTSDNGYMFGEHRLTKKVYLYEESARVPLIIRGPGFPAGVQRQQLAGNIDLAPTILDAADAAPRLEPDGRSLFPFARDPRVGAGRDLLLENGRSTAVRTPTHMYAEHPYGETELYDLGDDPFQLESRHADPKLDGLRTELARRLALLRDCAGETCR